MNSLYHYCSGQHTFKIGETGAILPSAAGAKGRERPAVWLTSRPTYEPTAVKQWEDHSGIRQLTLAEQATLIGLARIVVPASLAPLTWAEWVRESGVRKSEAKWMAKRAHRLGSDVGLYRATFEPIPLEACLGIDVSRDGVEWTRVMDIVDGELVDVETAPSS